MSHMSFGTTIQLHDDFGCSGAVFGTLVAHPEMGRRGSEPEQSLRKEVTHHVQHPKVRNDLHLVAVKLAGWSFDMLFPPHLEPDAVQTWLIGQQVGWN